MNAELNQLFESVIEIDIWASNDAEINNLVIGTFIVSRTVLAYKTSILNYSKTKTTQKQMDLFEIIYFSCLEYGKYVITEILLTVIYHKLKLVELSQCFKDNKYLKQNVKCKVLLSSR